MAGGGGGPGAAGLTPKNVTGTTTNALVQILSNTSANGIMGIGAIRNTDVANSLTVRETVTDKFGVTTSVDTPIPAGKTYLLDPQTSFNDGAGSESWPYFTSYLVKVIDTVGGTHATFEMHYSGLGTVS